MDGKGLEKAWRFGEKGMNHKRGPKGPPLILASIALLIVISTSAWGEQSVEEQFGAEIGRLRGAPVLALDTGDEGRLAVYQRMITNALDAAENALRDGKLFSCLRSLQRSGVLIAATEYLLREDLSGAEPEVFYREWEAIGETLTHEENRYEELNASAQLPAAVEAMAAVARIKSRTYYQASRRFAEIEAGNMALPYLGNCRAYIGFAVFCAGLQFPQGPPRPAIRPLEPLLSRLESEILGAYGRPGSADSERDFHEANAALELARELESRGERTAALLEYLTACYHLALATTLEPSAEDPSDLEARVEAASNRLAFGNRDDSIGRLFLESAVGAREAAAVLGRVLPAYYLATEGEQR